MLPRHGLHGVESSVAGGELSALSRLSCAQNDRTAVHAPVDEKRKQHPRSESHPRTNVMVYGMFPFNLLYTAYVTAQFSARSTISASSF